MSHAFTACDTLSMLWQRHGDSLEYIHGKFIPKSSRILLLQTEISDLAMEMLEQLVVLLYDHTSDITNANDSRKYLVTQKTRSFENLSPLEKC